LLKKLLLKWLSNLSFTLKPLEIPRVFLLAL
jgi:hypothetical protein